MNNLIDLARHIPTPDAFHDGPGAEALLTMRGVGHGIGGIAGLDARETETEASDVLEATKRLTLA